MVSGRGSPRDRCQDGLGSREPWRSPDGKPRLGSLGAAMMWAGRAEASAGEPGLGSRGPFAPCLSLKATRTKAQLRPWPREAPSATRHPGEEGPLPERGSVALGARARRCRRVPGHSPVRLREGGEPRGRPVECVRRRSWTGWTEGQAPPHPHPTPAPAPRPVALALWRRVTPSCCAHVTEVVSERGRRMPSCSFPPGGLPGTPVAFAGAQVLDL